eukprot:TRINITY_DN45703_c0_g1_i1.p1 TRINITY_DN45703_c0_g1~~TRINITY_DN45703_c0_g1_i1.p1  ORF type:complete len:370 (+),score=73.28 TRINITY_DN45703_c0_g1_i1:76-1185(+)
MGRKNKFGEGGTLLPPPPLAPSVLSNVAAPPAAPAPPQAPTPGCLPVGALIGDGISQGGPAVVPPPAPPMRPRGVESLHPELVAANPQLAQLIAANPAQPGAPSLSTALAAHNAKIAAAQASATMEGIPMSNNASMVAAVPVSQPTLDLPSFPHIDPDVQELCDHFHIEEKHTRRLSDLMKKRHNTFVEDIERLWEVLRKAHSPAGLLVVKMKEMDEGRFVGKTKPEKELLDVSRKHGLDADAESKLADILSRFEQDKRKGLTEQIDKHLEVSNRPSAAAMTLLRFLGEGIPLKKPGPAAPGSWLDRKRKEDAGETDGGDRGGGGGRDRRDRGDRDRGYRDDRERDRDRRDRDRDRSRSRRRSRSRGRR